MRRLILFRHAKTAPRAPGQEDIDRPLTERGIRDSAQMARRLAREGLIPDLVLMSPSLRTRQTWDHAAPAFPKARVEVVQAIYEASVDDLTAVLAAAPPDADTVMMIGHNPGLQELSVNLLIEGSAAAHHIEQLEARFPTAAAAAFLIDADGRAAFDGVFSPKDFATGESA